MSIGFLFWLLMILWIIFGAYTTWPAAGAGRLVVCVVRAGRTVDPVDGQIDFSHLRSPRFNPHPAARPDATSFVKPSRVRVVRTLYFSIVYYCDLTIGY